MRIDQALQQALAERERAYAKIAQESGGAYFGCDIEGLAEMKLAMDRLWGAFLKDEVDAKTRRALARKLAAATLQFSEAGRSRVRFRRRQVQLFRDRGHGVDAGLNVFIEGHAELFRPADDVIS